MALAWVGVPRVHSGDESMLSAPGLYLLPSSTKLFQHRHHFAIETPAAILDDPSCRYHQARGEEVMDPESSGSVRRPGRLHYCTPRPCEEDGDLELEY
jgi:hypothetical protein